jgi:hypothetical protein
MRTVCLAIVLAAAAPAAAQSLPVCGPPSTSPALTRYDELVPGARFRITLRHDAGTHTWMPSPALEILLHHANAITYVGTTLPAPSDRTLELEITALERVLVRVDESHHEWFFDYRVHVESVCERP